MQDQETGQQPIETQVTLASVGGEGALEQLFQEAHSKVLENVADLNCDPRKKRAINIKIEVTGTTDRTTVFYDVTVSPPKLVSPAAQQSSAYLGRQGDYHYASQRTISQYNLFDLSGEE